ncbi:hypothetical protein [Ruegeria arenilitoris]|uniref:hypothetical protein n=1 Tax=Ruegeria arenilitoris TaxID=1173585 RepID=UPI00147CC7B8|nr:hypothetical protein [Ruegeria arenilitoris]
MPWKTCEVTAAGPAENGVIYISLRATDGSFHHWFNANATYEREMLATALTAISATKTVWALLTATSAYSTINRLYVRA